MKPQVTTGVTVCRSGRAVLENFMEGLNLGTVVPQIGGSTVSYNTALKDNVPQAARYATVFGAWTSGNLGLIAPFGSCPSPYMQAGKYVASLIGTSLAGSGNAGNVLAGMSNTPHQNPGRFYAYQRVQLTSFDYLTGTATYGTAPGSVLASGLNGVTGQLADLSVGTIGNYLTFRAEAMEGGPLPSSLQLPTLRNTNIG